MGITSVSMCPDFCPGVAGGYKFINIIQIDILSHDVFVDSFFFTIAFITFALAALLLLRGGAEIMFERIVFRNLPDGRSCRLYPFHVCLKGLSDVILCREDEDYDAFVKYIVICAVRKNVLVVVYAVMSNHIHIVILAPGQDVAYNYSIEVKRMLSMFFAWKYGVGKVLKNVQSSAIYLDTNSYVRNAIAYTLKNPLDTGCKVEDYPWSSYRAVFPSGVSPSLRSVSRLSTREVEKVFHTNMDISSTGWKVDSLGRLDPASACEGSYAESAFNHDMSYFYRVMGMVDSPVVEAILVDRPRMRMNDHEFFKILSETTQRWFNKSVDDLSQENKLRLVPYIYHVVRTSPVQIARGLGLDRSLVEKLVKRGKKAGETR